MAPLQLALQLSLAHTGLPGISGLGPARARVLLGGRAATAVLYCAFISHLAAGAAARATCTCAMAHYDQLSMPRILTQ